MNRYCTGLALLAWLSMSMTGAAQAPSPAPATQEPKPAPTKPESAPAVQPGVPVQVEIRLARVRDGKEVGSLPYLMSAVAPVFNESAVNSFLAGSSSVRQNASIRAGVSVPIPSAGGSNSNPVTYSYRNVGTNIDCYVVQTPGGRFAVRISITDGSLYVAPGAEKPANAAAPILNSFEASSVFMADAGVKREFLVATDRINGETVRAEFTIRVSK